MLKLEKIQKVQIFKGLHEGDITVLSLSLHIFGERARENIEALVYSL